MAASSSSSHESSIGNSSPDDFMLSISSMTSSSSFTNSPEEHPQSSCLKKPHRSSDSSFQSNNIASEITNLSFKDFTIVRQVGSGDIGRVYLCKLRKNGPCGDLRQNNNNGGLYAMKVVDNEVLKLKDKTQRAETERKIMRVLDHPFLPTLYAEFEASHFSCVVMEFCPGGDLHSLRHKQPYKRFSLSSARFYAAEVLVALEYLHMLGIIYRDLKPENVLVRSDGHIMLTDFDLSMCSNAVPAVESPTSSPATRRSPPFSGTIGALASRFSCFPISCRRLFRSKKTQPISPSRPSFVAEPVAARSLSFVGTHEYVAPEVASGGSHGNAVDWWALGIFLYEMVYGFTPFAGSNNGETLRNITKRPLTFPTAAPASSGEARARDLISKLLVKDPDRRIGSRRGAADVKCHEFFRGLNFALVRSVTPPSAVRRRATSSSPHGRLNWLIRGTRGE